MNGPTKYEVVAQRIRLGIEAESRIEALAADNEDLRAKLAAIEAARVAAEARIAEWCDATAAWVKHGGEESHKRLSASESALKGAQP